MIKLLDNGINLGLRPNGLYELVDSRTARTTFLPNDPGGTPLDLIVNPFDVPFDQRPRGFLTSLRDERARLLELSRTKKRSNRKASPNGSPARTRAPSKRRPRQLNADTSALLSANFDSATANAIRRALGG